MFGIPTDRQTLPQVGEGDFFWEANGRRQFPKVAEDIDAQLSAYRAAVDDLNRKSGANVSADMNPNELMQVAFAAPNFICWCGICKKRQHPAPTCPPTRTPTSTCRWALEREVLY